eukprot:CAMPEP_0176230682 /NCGR_PEP_ID=MMETSP0121_2-20121125/24420_1 /TAXON_ID=160619 /ORGANISM="Kryptoperidinium foliaceum, Strain CCMP 1326" /LENGTH=452 /DNA_ID=CAMNT_0017570023 /DNA_START=88 /DNA_END=1444 /DNA_ORIENTATION=-
MATIEPTLTNSRSLAGGEGGEGGAPCRAHRQGEQEKPGEANSSAQAAVSVELLRGLARLQASMRHRQDAEGHGVEARHGAIRGARARTPNGVVVLGQLQLASAKLAECRDGCDDCPRRAADDGPLPSGPGSGPQPRWALHGTVQVLALLARCGHRRSQQRTDHEAQYRRQSWDDDPRLPNHRQADADALHGDAAQLATVLRGQERRRNECPWHHRRREEADAVLVGQHGEAPARQAARAGDKEEAAEERCHREHQGPPPGPDEGRARRRAEGVPSEGEAGEVRLQEPRPAADGVGAEAAERCAEDDLRSLEAPPSGDGRDAGHQSHEDRLRGRGETQVPGLQACDARRSGGDAESEEGLPDPQAIPQAEDARDDRSDGQRELRAAPAQHPAMGERAEPVRFSKPHGSTKPCTGSVTTGLGPAPSPLAPKPHSTLGPAAFEKGSGPAPVAGAA